jgi:hypothetical protein
VQRAGPEKIGAFLPKEVQMQPPPNLDR